VRGVYRIAEKDIEILSVYPDVHRQCAAYRSEASPELCVETTQRDIERERERAAREAVREGRAVQEFPLPYLESLAVYRKIAEKMPACGTFLLHGSAIAVDGQGYLFTAKSGTGKSTHTRLWRELLGARAVMVNDDKPLIRMTERGAVVHGTPWRGKEELGGNLSAPLKAVCLLERAAHNHIRAASRAEAYPLLLQQIYRPADREAMRQTLALLDALCAKVKLYRLGCNMDPEAAEIAYHAMEEGKS